MREIVIFTTYSIMCLFLGSYLGFTSGLIILFSFLLLSTIALAVLDALGIVSFRLETEIEVESE